MAVRPAHAYGMLVHGPNQFVYVLKAGAVLSGCLGINVIQIKTLEEILTSLSSLLMEMQNILFKITSIVISPIWA
jgi:hypothetical protein